MVDIKISGRQLAITDSMREYVNDKIGSALKVFDIKPMSCDVVLREYNNPSNPNNQKCEVTVFVRDYVIRVEASHSDLFAAIDEAADKAARQLRKYKTRVIDDSRASAPKQEAHELTKEDLDALLEPLPEEEDDELVRVKYVDLTPMSEDQALFQTDLIGHDFFVYIDNKTGLVNVAYRRNNGGYGILKPKIEELDD